ncbi:C39 family peptidase [Massilia forsythiae]|uniref:C39 family peptidase n=1 Tax=Massilia forsythiae TaxID=2728020 RepID=A0A7Z2ZUA6_9BURK|nr:C39 family peptidase [Massilia forsythiae]QJE02353.1 C39 family peptidase [Massilia forsythiae]
MKRHALTLLCALLGAAGARAADVPLASGARFNVPVHSLKELRFTSTLRQQYDFSCGSAALATLLTHHYDYPISETNAFQSMWAHGDQEKIKREGFSLLDMQRYLGSIGFKADGFRQPLAKLFEAKLPAIVLITEKGYNHFVVVKGAEDGRILLGDPSSGTRAMQQKDFEAIWPTKLLFVIHESPTKPQFNLTADWRAAPHAPVDEAVSRTALDLSSLPKFGPGDF